MEQVFSIYTVNDLKTFRNNVNGGTNNYSKIEFKSDINLNKEVWTPIGNENYHLTGVKVNGNGHKILNLVMTMDKYCGLFGYCDSTTIHDLSICGDSYFNSYNTSPNTYRVGSICGYAKNCNIINCYSQMTTNVDRSGGTITNISYGGIVGEAENCNIDSCIFNGRNSQYHSITTIGTFNVGGIVGHISNKSTVSKCCVYNIINIHNNTTSTSTNCVSIGGIIGSIGVNDSTGNIINTESTIELCSVDNTLVYIDTGVGIQKIFIGGITGLCNENETIKKSITSCNIFCRVGSNINLNNYNHKLCGISTHAKANNCYTSSVIKYSYSIDIPSPDNLYIQSISPNASNCYASYNTICESYLNDILKNNFNHNENYTRIPIDDFTSGKVCYDLNNGLSDTPFRQIIDIYDYPSPDVNQYIVYKDGDTYYNNIDTNKIININTADDLKTIRTNVNDNKNTYEGYIFNLTADITLNDDKWISIGKDADHPFYGKFNGNGHTISNFGRDVKDNQYNGLFGYCVNDTKSIDGGYITKLNVKNIKYTGEMSKESILTGGIAASAYRITKCSVMDLNVNITITTNRIRVGGICASATDVSNCYVVNSSLSYNTPHRYNYTGGIASCETIVRNCYAIISLNAIMREQSCYTGGIIGSNAFAINCYANTKIEYYANQTGRKYSGVGIVIGRVQSERYSNFNYANYGYNNGVSKISYNNTTSQTVGYQHLTAGTDFIGLPSDSFTTGEVCYYLNGKQSISPIFYQTIGEDEYPVIDNTHQRIDISTIRNISEFYNTINDNNKVLMFDNNIDFITSYNYQNQIYNNVILNEHKIFNVKLPHNDKLFYQLDNETDKENITYDKSNTISYLSYDEY